MVISTGVDGKNANNAKKVFKSTVKDERYVDTLDQFVLLWGRGGGEFQVP